MLIGGDDGEALAVRFMQWYADGHEGYVKMKTKAAKNGLVR